MDAATSCATAGATHRCAISSPRRWPAVYESKTTEPRLEAGRARVSIPRGEPDSLEHPAVLMAPLVCGTSGINVSPQAMMTWATWRPGQKTCLSALITHFNNVLNISCLSAKSTKICIQNPIFIGILPWNI